MAIAMAKGRMIYGNKKKKRAKLLLNIYGEKYVSNRYFDRLEKQTPTLLLVEQN